MLYESEFILCLKGNGVWLLDEFKKSSYYSLAIIEIECMNLCQKVKVRKPVHVINFRLKIEFQFYARFGWRKSWEFFWTNFSSERTSRILWSLHTSETVSSFRLAELKGFFLLLNIRYAFKCNEKTCHLPFITFQIYISIKGIQEEWYTF